MALNLSYLSQFGLETAGFLQIPGRAKANYCENFKSQDTEGLECRQGYQSRVQGVGGYGTLIYTYLNIDNVLIEEKLLIDSSLHRIKEGTLNITYSGANPRATVKVIVESGQFRLQLIDGNSEVLDRALGQGFDEASTETISDTATAITAVSGFSASVTGTSTIASAFLEMTPELSIPSGYTKTITFYYTEEVDKFVTNPLDGIYENLGTDLINNIDWVVHNGTLVLTDGNYPKVYDGNAIYLAGLPKPVPPVLSKQSSGKISGDYFYYLTYSYVNYQGNLTESAFSDAVSVSLSSNKVELNIKTLESNSGYNTKYAICNGSQTPVLTGTKRVITVDSGHSLKVGDFAAFHNSHESVNSYRAYTIDAVTSTTITVRASENITIADDEVISNNLAINIYRASTSLTTRYLIKSLANDPRVPSVKYTDNKHSAIVNGAKTYPSIAGQVSIIVDSGSDFVKGDYAIFPTQNTSLEVLEVSGTKLTVKSNTSLTVVDDEEVIQDNPLVAFIGNISQSRDAPPKADTCSSYAGSLFLGKDLFFVWSDESDILVTNSGQAFNLSSSVSKTSRPIKKLDVSGDSLVMLQDTRIDRFTSIDPSTSYVFSEISSKLGLVSSSAIAKKGARLFFLDKSGVYELNNGILSLNRTSSTEQQLAAVSGLGGAITLPIVDYFRGSKTYQWSRAVLEIDPQHNHLFISLPIEKTIGYATKKSDTLLYELDKDRWFLHKNFDLSGGVAVDSNFNLFFTSRTYGTSKKILFNKLLRDRTTHGYNDHTTAITQKYKTKYDILIPELAHDQKLVGALKLYNIKQSPTDHLHNPTIGVKAYKDYVDIAHSSLSYTFPAQPSSGEWDTFFWDVSPYGSWVAPYEKQELSHEKVESLSLEFSNSEASMNAQLTGWVLRGIPLPSNLKE